MTLVHCNELAVSFLITFTREDAEFAVNCGRLSVKSAEIVKTFGRLDHVR